jgi:hypothetical protein
VTAQYDSNILQQYADQLYRQASRIVVWTVLRYGFAVFVVSIMFFIAIGSQKQIDVNAAMTIVLILTLLGCAAGVDAGRRKAFSLKLQAQQILCQREIEQNTRPAK